MQTRHIIKVINSMLVSNIMGLSEFGNLLQLQNRHHGFSASPASPFLLLTDRSLPLMRQKYTGTPAATNATTSIVCSGCAKTALLSRKRLTQQKMMGVAIHVL